MNNIIIDVKNVAKSFGEEKVVREISFYVKEREFITILGPSGCGKTTTLRMIAGFEYADSGEIVFEGKNINNLPANEREINTVFQKYALFPHMNIYDNVAFGLRIKKLNEKVIKEKVTRILKLVNLAGFEKRSVNALSGGQQQRVAIARALVNEPKVLLLDEPLGALDLKLRKEMQFELKKMQQESGITFIYVTHDQEEALTMSDTIIVMNEGEIQQIGTPIDIYNEPKNSFVADFIGESNIFDGRMMGDYKLTLYDKEIECVDKGFKENQKVDVVIRPEDITIVDKEEGLFQGLVKSIVFKGVHYEILVESMGALWMIHSTDMPELESRVAMTWDPEDIHIMEKKDV
ncbi:MAG: ABC transporter ATP-binding protein [Firmicutes bacterium]|nr:ABC transporter ATP-binding protein [Bacillota bacterium]